MTPLLHMHFSCHGLKLPMCFCHENILQEFEHTQALRLRSRTFNMRPLCNIFLHRVTFHVLADEFFSRHWNRGALGLSWISRTSSKTDYGTRNELRIPFPLLEIHFTEKKPTRTGYQVNYPWCYSQALPFKNDQDRYVEGKSCMGYKRQEHLTMNDRNEIPTMCTV